jgi:hypothetical protein
MNVAFCDSRILCSPGSSVADPDPVSVDFLRPGIPDRFFRNLASDPGPPTHIFDNLVTIVWVKSTVL